MNGDEWAAMARRAAMGRGGRVMRIMLALLAGFAWGCAGDGARLDADKAAAASKKGSRERELDLVIPQTVAEQEDLTSLDDATLARRIAEANQQVNERTGKAFLHAASATEGDLARDAQYRKLLLEAKLAENELDRLEAEKARRVRR